MYALADKTCTGLNKFEAYVKSINDDRIDVSDNGCFKYGECLRLCKKLVCYVMKVKILLIII